MQQLFAAFFFLTAIWIVTGNSSRRNLWDVAVVFRMAIWLSIPVYLHLHWSFPRSLRSLPGWVFPLLYLLGIGAALLQWFELLPKQAYAFGLLLALLGSLLFLLVHIVRRPDFFYLIAMGTGVVTLAAVSVSLPLFPGQDLVTMLALSLAATLITLTGYPRFAHWIEANLLGMPHAPETLLESYLARITTSLNRTELIRLLRDEVLPSLLIRQSALLLNKDTAGRYLYTQGVTEEALPHLSLDPAASQAGPANQQSLVLTTELPDWVRLAIPVAFGERVLGLWLLGRHDPDDLYAASTITILQNIARQTAMALANIEQAEQLQAFYRLDIQRHEAERTRLARSLHDDILNQAANAFNRLERAALSPEFQAEYEILKDRVRRMISDLRPTALRWGLTIALEELVDDLNERNAGPPTFDFAVAAGTVRYPPHWEEQIYRIVQQACENARRHSQAARVRVSGALEENGGHIHVVDDGVGFALDTMEISWLLEQKHYGLIGMYERAQLIGAELVLEAKPGEGTAVHLYWSGNGDSHGEPGERLGAFHNEGRRGTTIQGTIPLGG